MQVDGPLRQVPVERRQGRRLCPPELQRDDSRGHPGAAVVGRTRALLHRHSELGRGSQPQAERGPQGNSRQGRLCSGMMLQFVCSLYEKERASAASYLF